VCNDSGFQVTIVNLILPTGNWVHRFYHTSFTGLASRTNSNYFRITVAIDLVDNGSLYEVPTAPTYGSANTTSSKRNLFCKDAYTNIGC
jgi:hypothetical protein